MVHADLICVPQLMSGEQALAAQIGGSGALLGFGVPPRSVITLRAAVSRG